MDSTEIKKDFYKRFEPSSNFLTNTKTGMLCNLLGYDENDRCSSINCTLSMCVQIFGRKLNGEIIRLLNTKSNICENFFINDCLDKNHILFNIVKNSGLKIHGAEMLYESNIPEYFSVKEPLKTAIFKTLTKIYSTNTSDIDKSINICADNDNKAKYLSLFTSKKGYASYITHLQSKLLPFPMTGYNFITVQTKLNDNSSRNKYIEKAYSYLKTLYPHISSFDDVTEEMAARLRDCRNHKIMMKYVYFIIEENKRIERAVSALKSFDIKSFFNIINESQKSMEYSWDIHEEYSHMAKTALKTDGVKAVRFFKNGIVCIAEEELTDHVINTIYKSYSDTMELKFCVADFCE